MKISVVIIAKNESGYLKCCLEALLKQSFQEFEIIMVDNGSTDETREVVDSFRDERIKYLYDSSQCGIAALRNLGIKRSMGEYIFFTDGDCVPHKYWLEEGLKVLESKEYVGVEGKTFYESQSKITISDYDTHQFAPGLFMTCNIAYARNVLERVNYFDPIFKYGHEDRDLAFRVMKFGKIYFSPDMLVSHQKKRLTIRALFNRAKWADNKVYFIKKHGSCTTLYKKILYPKRLFVILCPPLLLLSEAYRGFCDLFFGFFKYISLIYERILIWKAAIKYRIFIL